MRTTAVSHYPKIPNRPRPARLRAAIGKRDRGQITPEEFARVQDEVTAEVIAEQIEAGLDVVTDGQIRWDDDLTYIASRLEGFQLGGLIRYFDTNTYYRQPRVTGPVRWRRPILVRDYEFAASASDKPVKAVLTGPYTLAALSTDVHYNDRRKLVLDLADALRNEVEALAAAGAPIIQVSEPAIVKEKGDAPLVAEALARLFDGVEAETAVYTWFGDLDGALPALLDTPVDTIGLDFRMGPANWDAIKAAKFDKTLGFGIVDARNTKMESPQEIADAVKRVGEHVPLDRLYLNPSAGLEYLPREVAFDKLKNMVEGARLAEPVTAH